jgi:hypothetical protein
VTDVQGARLAGAHSIGYANEPGKPEPLSEAGAGAIINSLADLALRLRARVADQELLQLSPRFQGRTFGAPGLTALALNSGDGRGQSRERAARVTRRRRPGFTRGSRRCGAAAFAASFGRKPYGAAAAAHGTPGDRPPAVPAVSRCRARQHHGQAVAVAVDTPIAVKVSQLPGRNAAHCPGWPLRPQRCSASR